VQEVGGTISNWVKSLTGKFTPVASLLY